MFLVRHPETKNPFSSKNDEPPDAHGKVQAIKVAGFFKDKTVKKILTSPTKRTRYQADAISKTTGVPAEEDARLRPFDIKASSEQDYNTKLDAAVKNPDSTPEGSDETYNQFTARVRSFHSEHAGEPDTVAVTHSKNIMTHKDIAVGSGAGTAARNKIKDVRISTVDAKRFKPELVIRNSAQSEREDA